MALTDPIADYLTRIRNAQMAGHRLVEIPGSKLKRRITEILYEQGYIFKYKFDQDAKGHSLIKIAIKYDQATRLPIIQNMQRYSRPGLRRYVSAAEMPRVKNGLGVAVVSTSKGVMTDKQARQANVGGEVLFTIY